MSQIQSFVGSMGPAGPILTLTGDIGGAVGPTGGNINIVGEVVGGQAFAIIEGNPGTSTLNVVARTDEVVTNDAVFTFFPNAFYALANNQAVVMTANVIGHKDDFSAACGGFCVGIVRRAGAGAIFVGDNALASEDSGPGIPQFGISNNGNNIQVIVQGVAGETWNWTCTYQYQVNLI
jgi:hypothetical protein